MCEARRWPMESLCGVEHSTSLRRDWRKLGPSGRAGGPRLSLRAELELSAALSDGGSLLSRCRLVLGLFNGRAGSGAWGTSDGEAVGDFRFLALVFESDWITLAFSRAFQARSSSCDSGSGEAGRSKARTRRISLMSKSAEAVSRNLFAPPCRSAI